MDNHEMSTCSNSIEMSRDRRSFIKSIAAGAAGMTIAPLLFTKKAHSVSLEPAPARVSFVTGTDRRDMMHRVLEPLRDDIRKEIQGKQIVIKANLVGPDELCATHADAVRGVLDFLKPIYKKRVIVGDSTGRTYPGPMGTWKHFEIHGYLDLPKEYNIKLVDFNDMPTNVLWIIDKDYHPFGINIINTFLDPDNYIISLTRPKTHNGVITTLSVKNIVMGSPISHYKQRSVEGRNEKSFMHSGSHDLQVQQGFKTINFNIFLVAQHVRPQLAVIDGLVGMEGNGPNEGTAVEHGIALAGTDRIAVDRIAVELMGINFDDVGYLTYCAHAGMGQSDLGKITIIGPDIRKHIIPYKPHEEFEKQLAWKEGLVIDKR